MKEYKQEVTRPAVYSFYYRILHKIAYDSGYALALHGSMIRDCDLIAVAWHERCIGHEELIDLFVKELGGYIEISGFAIENHKPYGRLSYSIQIGYGLYFDISVIPPNENHSVFCLEKVDRHPVTKEIIDYE